MRISRRTSGGRGEYELSGSLPNVSRVRDLEGYSFSLQFPKGVLIHTRVRMVIQGGKPRLRRSGVDIHVQKQIAATFMMPDPARETRVLGAGEPVLQEGAYAIEHIEIDSVVKVLNHAVMKVTQIVVLNRSHLGEEIDLRQRARMLEEVWKRRAEFPEEIATLLETHEEMVRSEYVDSATQCIVARLQRLVSERSVDLGVVYSQRGDVLPKLAEALQYQVPQPLLVVEDVDPEDIDLRRRRLKEWKRWANARGPASARFKQEVRKAYQATCIVCGAHFPPTPYNLAPGVDAAHILPWRDDELDEVFNGLCLCKVHHWAFDEALIRLRYEDEHYLSEMPNEVEPEIVPYDPLFSLDKLRGDLGIIPAERLPADRRQWPHPDLLDRLAAMY